MVRKWEVQIDIDFSSGEYLYALIDCSSCTNVTENILDFGVYSATWNNNGYHFYLRKSTNQIEYDACYNGGFDQQKLSISDFSNIVLKIESDGVYINSEKVPTTNLVSQNLINYLITQQKIYLGSSEGNTRFYGTYKEISIRK